MDKIWYRNPSKSEVIGRCGGDEKNRMTTQNRPKSNGKNKQTNTQLPNIRILELKILILVVNVTHNFNEGIPEFQTG